MVTLMRDHWHLLVCFQNDLEIDNLLAKHSGDYDPDGIHEVYWKTNDGTAYLRSWCADGNINNQIIKVKNKWVIIGSMVT